MNILITIPRPIIAGIFEECDRWPTEETGGRLLGFYSRTTDSLEINVKALIGPGPKAERTSISFFGDGEYQERIFRAVERQHPTIEHLGNWHTHHPNGLLRLSPGDRATYQRIVNHRNHNTDFFYALLVTERYEARYRTKHYILFRDNAGIYELRDEIRVVDAPVLSFKS